MKNILCFGDSNTWGFIPLTGERLPRELRWTGLLQKALGDDYYVIEAGLNSRTVAFDDPIQPDRNGLKSARMLIMQAQPLDMIIVMLGSNDTKNYLGQNSCSVTKAMDLLLKNISSYYYEEKLPRPAILLAAPIDISDHISSLPTGTEFDEKSVKIIREIRDTYRELALQHDCKYIDAGQYASPSPLDGLHMTTEGHAAFALAVEKKVRQMLG